MRPSAIRVVDRAHPGFGNEILNFDGGRNSRRVSMGMVAVLAIAIVVSLAALRVDATARGDAPTVASALSHLPMGG